MTSDRTWSTRRYLPGDELDLLALFNRVFGRSRSLDHWRWQFERNPYAPPTIVVARRRSDDLLAGSHVVMPVALNASGERFLAAHTLDLVVHEDFRRQGIFETTALECFDWCRERGMRAVFAFPNAQSYPGFVRTLGWSRILDPERWDLRLGLSQVGGSAVRASGLTRLPDLAWRSFTRLGLGRRSRWSVDWQEQAPEDQDALWSECAPELRLSLWKDREYLRWRYDSNPDHRFRYLTLRSGSRLCAVAVVHTEQGRTTICDLISPRAAGDSLGRALVVEVCHRALREGDDRVGFVGRDDGYFARCLGGFRRRPAPESVLTGRGLAGDDVDRLVRDGTNWTLCFGDADYV